MSNTHQQSRDVVLSLLVVIFVVASGCGGQKGPPTIPVSGTVKLDGEPIAKGEIIFKDFAGKEKASAGPIKDGKFSFPSTFGKKKVEISAQKEVKSNKKHIGGIPGDPISDTNPSNEMVEMFPPKYNTQTELTVEVDAQNTTFPFDLKSGK